MTAIPRADAVDEVAAALADRTAFVVLPPHGGASRVAARLRGTGWRVLLDNRSRGTAPVLCCRGRTPIRLAEALVPVEVVFLIPAAVPVAGLESALDVAIPPGRARDLLVLDDPGGIVWPSMFVAALARVDPAAARLIRDTAPGGSA